MFVLAQSPFSNISRSLAGLSLARTSKAEVGMATCSRQHRTSPQSLISVGQDTSHNVVPFFLKLNNGDPIDHQIARRTNISPQYLPCPNGWLHAVKSPRGTHSLGHLGVNFSAGHMKRANRRNLPPACRGRSTRCVRPHSSLLETPTRSHLIDK
jgi:hypothetical protein